VSLLRFLRPDKKSAPRDPGETATVREIAARLERLPADKARFLAGFAFVLARVANADLEIVAEEADEMRRIVVVLAELSQDEADLVVEMAKSQARLLGGTENYTVTREFRKISSREQRGSLLECVYAVAAADGTISGPESNEILSIAEELGFTRPEALSLRSRYRDKLSVLQGGDVP
jgi:uncharacterized tellurite resistance protein B-like protein